MGEMKQRIEHPICATCDPHRQHPVGAPHLINGSYFEELAGVMSPLPVHEAKAEHRRASVREAVRRLRAKAAQGEQPAERAA